MLDVIIIGSGPAGLSAAVYAKRANLNVILIEKEYMGTGQIAYSSQVDNYLGLPKMSGYDLGETFRNHAEEFGVEFVEGEVTKLEHNNGYWTVSMLNEDEKTVHYETQTVVYATGSSHRLLGCTGEDTFQAKGVSYCAVCDGSFYKDKVTAVIGGGDTALNDALYLSELCETVYLIHRRDTFRGSVSALKKLEAKENVKIITNATVSEISGDKKVTSITLNDGTNLEVQGVFVAVGMIPQTALLKEFDVLDAQGYIIADETCATSAEGLYVAGDVRTKKLRQAITAAADGACAIQSVQEYLLTK